MTDVVARIDDFGRPAWIALMVIGFIVFWPIGLAILAYLIWSGRMGCGCGRRHASSGASARPSAGSASASAGSGGCSSGAARRACGPAATAPSTNTASEALRRLEEEANEFRAFLERLRMAKDRAEFDEFMRERRNRPAGPGPTPPEPQPQA